MQPGTCKISILQPLSSFMDDPERKCYFSLPTKVDFISPWRKSGLRCCWRRPKWLHFQNFRKTFSNFFHSNLLYYILEQHIYNHNICFHFFEVIEATNGSKIKMKSMKPGIIMYLFVTRSLIVSVYDIHILVMHWIILWGYYCI